MCVVWYTAATMIQSDNTEPEDNSPPPTLEDLATLRQRPVLYLHGDMDYNSVNLVQAAAPLFEEFKELSILLVSLGGDIESAYRMILALRESVGDIEVLVPYWAKSAATFFCLAANSIHMGKRGELGPLDPQLIDRTGSARPVSALESFHSLEHLLSYSIDSLHRIVQLVRTMSPMDVPSAIEHSHQPFAAIVSPLYSQVDPHELGEAGRALSESEEYAIRVMEWSYADITSDAMRQIARSLVYDYPTHGFVIDLIEARAIGLKAARMEPVSDAVCQAIVANEDYNEVVGFPQEDGSSGISPDCVESCNEE